MRDDEEGNAGERSAAAPRVRDVVGPASCDHRALRARAFVEHLRADRRHLEIGVETARRIAVLEPPEEAVATDSQTVASGCPQRRR